MDNMDKEMVKSATASYLVIGIVYGIVFIFAVVVTPQLIIRDKAYYMIPILVIPFILLGGIGLMMIDTYKKRKEFCIYSLKKEGIINFDELNKEYVQVKDTADRLYFVRKEDESSYSTYALVHG